jgi:hypothetical protein
MMIIHAVRSAASADAVYFLVNAYIEALSHFKCACGVPEPALELPVNSPMDLHRRLHVLEHPPLAQGETAAAISELSAVIRAALARLEVTGNFDPVKGPAATRYYARNDSPRSSQSV